MTPRLIVSFSLSTGFPIFSPSIYHPCGWYTIPVGSSKFDDRFFETNDEITLGFHDRALAKRLEEIFEDDRKDCIELNADHWKKRGLLHRAQDSALYLFNEVL